MTCYCTAFDPSWADSGLCECGHVSDEHDDEGNCFGDYGDDL